MKLGIVGSGMIVQEFLPSLVKLEGLEIVGMQGTKASIGKVEEICIKYGIPNFTDDFDELCEFGIDTVYIAVPNFLHFEFCKKALEKGLNVIVEKPMTTNYKEAEKLSAPDLRIIHRLRGSPARRIHAHHLRGCHHRADSGSATRHCGSYRLRWSADEACTPSAR